MKPSKYQECRKLLYLSSEKTVQTLSVPCRLHVLSYVKFLPFSTFIKPFQNDRYHCKQLVSMCYGYFVSEPRKIRQIHFINSNLTMIFSTYISAKRNTQILSKNFVPFGKIYKICFSPSCEINKKKVKKFRKFLYKIIPKCKKLRKLDYGVGQVIDSSFLVKIKRLTKNGVADTLVKLNLHDSQTFSKALELFPNLKSIVKWKDQVIKTENDGKYLVRHMNLRRLKSTPNNKSLKYILLNKSLKEVRLYVENLNYKSLEKLFNDSKLKVIKTANLKVNMMFNSIINNKNLEKISFSFMGMKDRSNLMKSLSMNSSGKLTNIWIDNSKLSDNDLLLLLREPLIRNLRTLNVSKNVLVGEFLPALIKCTKLSHLDVSGNQLFGSTQSSQEKFIMFLKENVAVNILLLMKLDNFAITKKLLETFKSTQGGLIYKIEVNYHPDLLKMLMKFAYFIKIIVCHFYSEQRESVVWIRKRDKPTINFFGSPSQVMKEEKKAKKRKELQKRALNETTSIITSSQRTRITHGVVNKKELKKDNNKTKYNNNITLVLWNLCKIKKYEEAIIEARNIFNNKMINDKVKDKTRKELLAFLKREDKLMLVTCQGCEKTALWDLKKCSRCKTVFYCSRLCQTRDWKRHKHVCKTPN